MGKCKYDSWTHQIKSEESVVHHEKEADLILDEAYDALNRFYQKDQRRGKETRKVKQCWQ